MTGFTESDWNSGAMFYPGSPLGVPEAVETVAAPVESMVTLTSREAAAIPAPVVAARSSSSEAARVSLSAETAVLLRETHAFIGRFVVLGEAGRIAATLWAAHTYVFRLGRRSATPYLHFYSAEPGSGKTTALEVLAEIVREPQSADDVTGPSLFRMIEELTPTLLIDEVDGIVNRKGDDRARDVLKILKSGYTDGKYAIRMGGPQYDRVDRFNVYCPKALAGLHGLKDAALASRCISIKLEPALQTELREDFDPEEVDAEAEALRLRWAAWAESARDVLAEDKPERLPDLPLRTNQIWRTLFRIADLAGDEWPEQARSAARSLYGLRDLAEESIGRQLLRDVHIIFGRTGRARLARKELHQLLTEDEEMRWGDFYGETLTEGRLRDELRRYGITTKTVQKDDGTQKTAKGYKREWFEDAWMRHCPDVLSDASASSDGSDSANVSEKACTDAGSDVPTALTGGRADGTEAEQFDLSTASMDTIRELYEEA